MDAIEVTQKIEVVIGQFGMSGKKAAEAMGISYDAFRKRRINSQGNSFNEQNLHDLINFIKLKAAALNENI